MKGVRCTYFNNLIHFFPLGIFLPLFPVDNFFFPPHGKAFGSLGVLFKMNIKPRDVL